MQKLTELIDTHAHLDFPEFADSIPAAIQRALQAGVSTIVTIGIDLDTSRRAAQIAGAHDRIYASAGIHPHASFSLNERDLRELKKIAAERRVVAIGEIGLDYFHERQPRPVQAECMRTQIQLAVDAVKPVIFHIRDAWEDFFQIVAEFAPCMQPSVMHCFSGDWEVARRCLDLGLYLSIPGVVTFPKAESLQDVVRRAPLDRLLVETDSPYLAPVPHRGRTNEPAFVLHTATKIAECRKEALDKVAAQTTQNARAVFGI
ncbi:MAG: TatD family hydrolase [Syntrophobacteraceae bacterium]|jgi:TatD DNase family protein